MNPTIQQFFQKVMELTTQGKMKWETNTTGGHHTGIIIFGEDELWIRFVSNTGFIHGFVCGSNTHVCTGFLSSTLSEKLRLAINPSDVRESSMEFGPGIQKFISIL